MFTELLERVMSFQESLTATNTVTTTSEYTDGDDVYYRFGGATICDMLKLHYKQIRSCSDEQRDHLSQEIDPTSHQDGRQISHSKLFAIPGSGLYVLPAFQFYPILQDS